MTDATDRQLLQRFVAHRDEAAFATLARRHMALVVGVCRRVLRDERDTEDVVQATFLVLARKAVALPWQQSVGPWLSAVARRLASHARAERGRRRERPAGTLLDDDPNVPVPAAPGGGPEADVARRELCGLLHTELARLPEKYRAPVVLCYLEGKTNEQAARELGWPAGSMSRRLEKARQLLRERLSSLAVWVALPCLATAALWLARSGSPGDNPPSRVAVAMHRFQPGDDGRPGAEELLRRLTAQRPPDIDREQVRALAGEAVSVAEQVADHDPGRLRNEWRSYVTDLGTSARRLAAAAEVNDGPAILFAAARLQVACVRCHETFRD